MLRRNTICLKEVPASRVGRALSHRLVAPSRDEAIMAWFRSGRPRSCREKGFFFSVNVGRFLLLFIVGTTVEPTFLELDRRVSSDGRIPRLPPLHAGVLAAVSGPPIRRRKAPEAKRESVPRSGDFQQAHHFDSPASSSGVTFHETGSAASFRNFPVFSTRQHTVESESSPETAIVHGAPVVPRELSGEERLVSSYERLPVVGSFGQNLLLQARQASGTRDALPILPTVTSTAGSIPMPTTQPLAAPPGLPPKAPIPSSAGFFNPLQILSPTSLNSLPIADPRAAPAGGTPVQPPQSGAAGQAAAALGGLAAYISGKQASPAGQIPVTQQSALGSQPNLPPKKEQVSGTGGTSVKETGATTSLASPATKDVNATTKGTASAPDKDANATGTDGSSSTDGSNPGPAPVEAKSENQEDSGTALPVGAIVGIGLLCAFVVLGLVTITWCLWRDRGLHHRLKTRSSSEPTAARRSITVAVPSRKGSEPRSAIFDPSAFRSLTSRRFQSIESLPSAKMGRSRSGEARTNASDTEDNEDKRSPGKSQTPSYRSDNGREPLHTAVDADYVVADVEK